MSSNLHQNISKLSASKRQLISRLFCALGITLLAFTLSFFLSSPFSSSVSALFSSPEKTDFIMSDLFAQVADGRPVRHLDNRITVVDIGIGGRQEIADALNIISESNPKAIGLDVNFAFPSADDSYLLETLENTPNLVLPLVLADVDSVGLEVSECPFFYGDIAGPIYAGANLDGDSRFSTVRKYYPRFNLADGYSMPSFATALAEIVSHKELTSVEPQYIQYHSREFNILQLSDLPESDELLSDHIVLVGALSDASDMHATPVNHYVAGVLIHAYSLATILDGTRFAEVPHWLDYLLAFAVCFALVWATLSIKSPIKGLLLRILQVALLYLAVRLGYSLFVDHLTIINFQYTFLMVAFGLFAVDLWHGGSEIILFTRTKLIPKLKFSTDNV